MKQVLCRIGLIDLLVVLIFSTFSFAKQQGQSQGIGIYELYMTKNANDFLEQENFVVQDTPWLYMKLHDSVYRVTGNWWFWNKGNQNYLLTFDTQALDPNLWQSVASDNSDYTKNLWLRRLDITQYTAHDQWWHINQVKAYGLNGGKHQTKYHVTPEPISSALFLVGAAAFGLRRFTGKKKKVN
ncbi:MAG: PEP-CTERM sorting domain-containing protein [Candidatus Omnitrophica bacterium]|nr:PEP-CTERM sorting domain-containing protein [Candidatus Omnitrophota bacterium]